MQLEELEYHDVAKVCLDSGWAIRVPFQDPPLVHLRNGHCGGVAGVAAWIFVRQSRRVLSMEEAHPIVDVVVLLAQGIGRCGVPFQDPPLVHLRNGCCGGVGGVVAWIFVRQSRRVLGMEQAHPIVDVAVLLA